MGFEESREIGLSITPGFVSGFLQAYHVFGVNSNGNSEFAHDFESFKYRLIIVHVEPAYLVGHKKFEAECPFPDDSLYFLKVSGELGSESNVNENCFLRCRHAVSEGSGTHGHWFIVGHVDNGCETTCGCRGRSSEKILFVSFSLITKMYVNIDQPGQNQKILQIESPV